MSVLAITAEVIHVHCIVAAICDHDAFVVPCTYRPQPDFVTFDDKVLRAAVGPPCPDRAIQSTRNQRSSTASLNGNDPTFMLSAPDSLPIPIRVDLPARKLSRSITRNQPFIKYTHS
mmetsp:Transcript_156562/g.380197  ORF Transcript_156562/g.380197 Transcript_156562/m.380197 type:complete len:117 (-) Transcript_156562:475-825(-)